jgi:hypothetical protein
MEQKLLWAKGSDDSRRGLRIYYLAAQHDDRIVFVMYNARHPRADPVSKKYGAGSW